MWQGEKATQPSCDVTPLLEPCFEGVGADGPRFAARLESKVSISKLPAQEYVTDVLQLHKLSPINVVSTLAF